MNKTELALLLAVLGLGVALVDAYLTNKKRRQARQRPATRHSSPRSSKSQQTRAAARRLEDRGLVRNVGGTISPQRDAITLLLKRAAERYNLELILRGSNEQIFCSLSEPGTVTDIVRRTGLSVPTTYRALRDLYSTGAAQNRGGIIFLADSLKDLAKAMRIVSETDPHSHTIYKDAQKTLVSVPAGIAFNGRLTAFSRFGEFGMEYHTIRDYYIQQHGTVDMHDILVHALLAAAEYHDTNEMSMVLVFYLKHRSGLDTTRIRRVASRFGATNMWLDAESYIRNHTTNVKSFPPWEEFVEKARLYEVDPAEYNMPSPAERLFHDVGERLDKPVQIYLLGGENMRLKGLKNATKDCDIIVKDYSGLQSVIRALASMGYSTITPAEHTADDMRLYPTRILSHPTLPRMDIFTKRVMGDISLTDSMADSSDHIKFGNLEVGVLRNEHVFLLKAAAGRDGDIQDMAALVRGAGQRDAYNHGMFDWDMVLDEIKQQERSDPTGYLHRMLFDGLSYMEEQTGIKSPIMANARLNAVNSYVKWLSLGGWRPLRRIVEVVADGDISHSYVRNRARELIKAGVLEERRIGRGVLVYNDARFPHPEQKVDRRSVEEYMEWRFHPSETYNHTDMAALMQHIGCSTLGELDDAIRSRIRDVSYGTPAETVRMCLRR